MPLFSYKCSKCEHEVERFQHNSEEDLEITCEECGEKCVKQLPFTHTRVWLEAKDFYKEKIAPDAKKIMDNINRGKDKDFFDIYGDK